jgi:ankyrin repeat protein
MAFSSFFSSPETQAQPSMEDVKAFQRAALGGRDIDIEDALKKCPQLVNAQDDKGWTGLMMAATQGHFSTVRLLMENGADTALKNSSGQTTEQLAVQHAHANLVPFIQQLKTDLFAVNEAPPKAKEKPRSPKP